MYNIFLLDNETNLVARSHRIFRSFILKAQIRDQFKLTVLAEDLKTDHS